MRDRVELVASCVLGDRVDRADVAGGLERDRRHLGRVGKDGERRLDRSPPPNGYTTVVGRSAGRSVGDELLRLIGPRALVRLVDLRHLLAVRVDRLRVEPRGDRVVAAARGDAEHLADLRREVGALGGGLRVSADREREDGETSEAHRRVYRMPSVRHGLPTDLVRPPTASRA